MAGRLWAVLLTGVPFAVFKMGGGLAAAEDVSVVVGWIFIVWGGTDALLNLGALLWPRRLGYCLLSNVGRLVDRLLARDGRQAPGPAAPSGWRCYEQLLLALDTLLAFVIVGSMIWFGRIAALPPVVRAVWELCVIANILGVGIERVWRSWRG